jgi:ATP-dependent DNA helicase RecQ
MVQFAESQQCRMSALIQHFGDTADGLRPCGHCDFCAPHSATAQTFRAPTDEEDRQLRAILRALDGTTRATGKLHTELSTGALRNTPAADRKVFDTLLDALTRSGLITLNSDQWTNPEGNLIIFKKASLTHEGRTHTGPLPPDLLLKVSVPSSGPPQHKSSRVSGRPSKASIKAQREQSTASYTAAQKDLESRLRDWRKAEAAKTGKPAFMVFADSVLHSIVLASPTTIPALLQVSGVGPRISDNHGAAICALCDSRAIPGEYGEGALTVPTKRKRPTSPPPPATHTRPAPAPGSVETVSRQRVTPLETAVVLTSEQQALDQRLHEWRKAESEKLGMPLFFVLASSTLRNIVLAQPQTLSQLKTINGLNLEKIERFGPAIIEACTT